MTVELRGGIRVRFEIPRRRRPIESSGAAVMIGLTQNTWIYLCTQRIDLRNQSAANAQNDILTDHFQRA